MKNYFFCLLLIISFLFAFSCQKVQEDDEDVISEQKTSLLNVSARASENSIIEYPILIYAFDKDGNMISYQKLENENQTMGIELPEGKYKIVALAGVCSDYLLPDKPSLDSSINLKNGCSLNGALMMGVGNAILMDKKENLTITINYVVSSVYISLDKIPVTAKKVSMSLASFYSGISFNNEFIGSGEEITISCQKNNDGKWIAGPVYLFPGKGNNTLFSIIVEYDDSSKTYSYTYNDVLKACSPFIINGSYSGDLLVGANFVTNGWGENKYIDFNFGSGVTQDKPASEDSQDIPKIGSIWNDCIVAEVDKSEDGTANLLLLSTKEWDATISESTSLVESYSVKGLSDWRIPSYDEASYLRKTFNDSFLNELNRNLIDSGFAAISDDEKSRYLCYGKEYGMASFRFFESSNVVKATDEERIYLLRAVRRYSYKGE